MSEINLKLKTYDELTFEISRLNTDKYLLEQKLQQKENIIKEVREYIKQSGQYLEDIKRFKVDVLEPNYLDILKILDKVGDEK